MTGTSVADAMPTATVLQDYLSLFRTWWISKRGQYEFLMSTILMILNVAAMMFLYMHKIPFPEDNIYFQSLMLFYVLFGMLSTCLACSCAIFKVKAYDMYMLGRICHMFGFAIHLLLLYVISPHLVLFFGAPCPFTSMVPRNLFH